MSSQRYVSTSFWDDPWVCSLDPSEKLLYLYFMTGPLTNIAGVYELTIRRISFDTGFNTEMIQKIIDRFTKDGKAYHYESYIILPSWPKHQKWEQRSKIKQGIDKILSKLPENVLSHMVSIGYQYDLNYLDLDSDLDIDTDKELDIEARDFVTEYESIKKVWNKETGNDERKSLYQMSEAGKIKDFMVNYTEEEILKAILNYSKHQDCKKLNYGLRGFLDTGVPKYLKAAKTKEQEYEEDMII